MSVVGEAPEDRVSEGTVAGEIVLVLDGDPPDHGTLAAMRWPWLGSPAGTASPRLGSPTTSFQPSTGSA